MKKKIYSKTEIEEIILKAIDDGLILNLLPGFVPSEDAIYDVANENGIDEGVELIAESFFNSQSKAVC